MSHINESDPVLPVVDDPRYGRLKELIGLAQISEGGLRSADISVAACDVDAGKESPAHWHARTTEVYYVTDGFGRITLDGRTIDVKAGDACLIPIRMVHSIRALGGGLKLLVLTSPAYDADDDFEIDAHGLPPIDPPRTTIALLVGTHRTGSLSAKIARQVAGMYGDVGVAVDLIDPAELPSELYRPESYDERYNPETPLARQLIAADGIVTVTPEYNGSLSGIVKHLLDIVPYKNCFDAKPVAMIGVAAGDFGAVRTLDHLASIFGYRNAHVFGKRVYIKNVDEAPLDENGHLTDPEIVGRLRAQATGFADFVRVLAPMRARE